MESDAEETKSQLVETENPSRPRHKHKKTKKRKVQSVDATIQVIPENPERTAPVLGYFPSGFDPTKNPDPDSTLIGLYRQSSRAKRFQLVVHPDGTNVDFVGTSYTGEGATRESTIYGLGVLDKETGTLKIVPIVANKIFRLEPRVRGYDYSKPASVAMGEGVGELTRDEKADKHSKLQKTYGTKKSIMENKKMNDLKQEVGPEAQMNLDVKFKQTVPNKEALVDPEVHIIRSVPPYNESATIPQEVYPLDKIIVSTEWDVLQDIYDLVQGGAKLSVDAFPTFVCNRIHKLQDIEVEDEKFKLACIFSYITHLLKFKDQHSMDGVSSARGHKIPNLLYHKFRSMFASDSKRLPEDKTKLLISYVLVLTLFVDEFQTDLTDIAKDLRMSSITLRKYYQNLGCKLFHKNSFCFAELAVPLQFPEVRKRKKRSNR